MREALNPLASVGYADALGPHPVLSHAGAIPHRSRAGGWFPFRQLPFFFDGQIVFRSRIPATLLAIFRSVVDLADAFSPDEERVLAETVDHLEKTVGGQVRILTVKTLGKNVLEDYTLEVASNWGIGEAGKDNGALVFLAVDDRRNRIEVGYGWEGALTDARCGDLLRNAVPELRAEHYADACVKIVQGMEQYLAKSQVVDPGLGFARKGVIFVIPSIEPPVPAWNPSEPSFLPAFLGFFGILLTLLGIGLGYLGRIYSTSQPDYVIIDPVKIREELAQMRSSGGSSSSGRRSGSYRSGGFHGSSGGSHHSGGGGRFGGGGASGRW